MHSVFLHGDWAVTAMIHTSINMLAQSIIKRDLLLRLPESDDSPFASSARLQSQKSIFIILQDQDKSAAMSGVINTIKTLRGRCLPSAPTGLKVRFSPYLPLSFFSFPSSSLSPTFSLQPCNVPRYKRGYGPYFLISQLWF